MRDMLSVILRLILGIIVFFVIIVVVVFNYETGEDKRNIRLEEDRIAEYTAQNYKDVKKIEFKRFEKNISTQTWFIDAVINDNISVSYSLNGIGENDDIGIIYNPDELKERTKDEQNITEKSNVEIIYK
jgi:hypothetical protein